MELQEYLVILRKWWWLVILGVVLGGTTGYVVSRFEPPIYESKITLIIGNFVQSANPNTSELATSQQLAQSYAEIIRREPIMRATVSTLGLNIDWRALQQQVTVNLVPNTQLFEIRVTNNNPLMAKTIVDEIARQLILQSPTTLNSQQENQGAFIERELADLQTNITTLRQQIKDLNDTLELEVTTEGIQDRQRDINFLQTRLDSLQRTYASLLDASQTNKRVNNLDIVEPSVVPTTPINGDGPLRNGLLGAVFGLVATAGVAYFIEYLDDTVKTTEDVERVLNIPALAAVSRIDTIKNSGDSIVVNEETFSPNAEAYRILRTNIQFSMPQSDFTTLLVTSSINSEGKSMTAANLAIAIAQTNKRVILIDADLRRPSQHRIFKIPNRLGLSNLLLNQKVDLEEILARRQVGNLRVLSSGPLPPNPAELVGSTQMKALLEQLKAHADMVIIDSPPLLAVADASILATQVDSTMLVLESGRTRSKICQRGQAVLAQVGIKPIGVVLNKYEPQQDKSGYYYYYYYHSPYTEKEHTKRIKSSST